MARDNDTKRADQSKWDLGKITNFGIFTESTTYPTPDVVSFGIVMEVLEHPLNTGGATALLTAGMSFTDKKLWLGQNSITIASSSSAVCTVSRFL